MNMERNSQTFDDASAEQGNKRRRTDCDDSPASPHKNSVQDEMEVLRNENAYLRGRILEKEAYEDCLEVDLSAARVLARRLMSEMAVKDSQLLKSNAEEDTKDIVDGVIVEKEGTVREEVESILALFEDRLVEVVRNVKNANNADSNGDDQNVDYLSADNDQSMAITSGCASEGLSDSKIIVQKDLEIGRMKTEYDELVQSFTELSEMNEKVMAEKVQLLDQISRNVDLEEQVKSLTVEKTILEKDLQNHKTILQTNVKSLDDFKKSLNDAQVNLDKKERYIRKLTNVTKEMELSLNGKDGENQQLVAEVTNFEMSIDHRKIRELKSELGDREERLRNMSAQSKRRIAVLSSRNDRLEAQNNGLNRECEQMEYRICELQNVEMQLRNTIQMYEHDWHNSGRNGGHRRSRRGRRH